MGIINHHLLWELFKEWISVAEKDKNQNLKKVMSRLIYVKSDASLQTDIILFSVTFVAIWVSNEIILFVTGSEK